MCDKLIPAIFGFVGTLIGLFWSVLIEWLREKREQKRGLIAVHSELRLNIQLMNGGAWKHHLYFLQTVQWEKYQYIFAGSKSNYTRKVREGYQAATAYNNARLLRGTNLQHEDLWKDFDMFSQVAFNAFRAIMDSEPVL